MAKDSFTLFSTANISHGHDGYLNFRDLTKTLPASARGGKRGSQCGIQWEGSG